MPEGLSIVTGLRRNNQSVTLCFCFSQAIENFAMTVKTTAQMLQTFGTDLAETELPNDVQCTEELLSAHTDHHSKLKVNIVSRQHHQFNIRFLIQQNFLPSFGIPLSGNYWRGQKPGFRRLIWLNYEKGLFAASGIIEQGNVTAVWESYKVTSGIAWAPDEEFIKKDEFTLDQI